jgi:hypothetical protein
MIFNNSQNISWRKDRLFNKWCWENRTSTCRRLKLDSISCPVQNSINNSNILIEVLKLSNFYRKTLQYRETGKKFVSQTPIAQEIRGSIDKRD